MSYHLTPKERGGNTFKPYVWRDVKRDLHDARVLSQRTRRAIRKLPRTLLMPIVHQPPRFSRLTLTPPASNNPRPVNHPESALTPEAPRDADRAVTKG